MTLSWLSALQRSLNACLISLSTMHTCNTTSARPVPQPSLEESPYTIDSAVPHLIANAVGLLGQQLSGCAAHADTVVRFEVPVEPRAAVGSKCSASEAEGYEDLRETHIWLLVVPMIWNSGKEKCIQNHNFFRMVLKRASLYTLTRRLVALLGWLPSTSI